jgi:hypothetical protein
MQGGSSFNALVRAMKQQVVDTNTGARDPNLMFEINNMSMNQLQIFPDGELDVQARCSAPNSAAFVRPSAAARSLHAQRPASVLHPGLTRNAGVHVAWMALCVRLPTGCVASGGTCVGR